MLGAGGAASGEGTAKVSTTASGSGGGAGGFGRVAFTAGGALVTDVIGAHNRPGEPQGALQALARKAVATQSISLLIFLDSILPP